MSRKNTRRKRQEQHLRSLSETAAKRAAVEKASRLLAYHERQKSEEAAWDKYRLDIEKARETHCAPCSLSLMCMARRCPDDVMICTQCAGVFSLAIGLVVSCDGFNESLGLERAWHSGVCQECHAYPRTVPLHMKIVGFAVETPTVAALKRITTQHYGGCSNACGEEP